MPYRQFVSGEVLTATNVQNFLANQAVITCATSASRPTSPTTGMVVYLQDVKVLQVYDGTSWVQVFPVISSSITDGTIGTVDLADGAVTTAKIADGSITSAKIVDGAVATADLADYSVTTDKIANGTVTAAKVPGGETFPINITGNAGTAGSASVATELQNGAAYWRWSGAAWVNNSGALSVGTINSNNTIQAINGFYDVSPTTGSSSTQYYVWRSSDGKLVTRSGTSLRGHKDNIADVDGALDKVLQMRPRTFNFKPERVDTSDPQSVKALIEQTQYGFVVEEMLDIDDDLVIYDYDPASQEEPKQLEPRMWKDQAVLSLAVGAIKEMAAKIETLEARLEALEAKVN